MRCGPFVHTNDICEKPQSQVPVYTARGIVRKPRSGCHAMAMNGASREKKMLRYFHPVRVFF